MTTTANYNFELPTVGGDLDTWGDDLNLNWSNVDALLKVLYTEVEALKASRLTSIAAVNLLYPIGSIYISIKSANPSTIFAGTTWVAKAAGRALVGVGTADGLAWVVNDLKGTVTVTLDTTMIPAHEHSIDPPSTPYTTGGQSADHTHAASQPAHTHALNDPTHMHAAGDAGHAHPFLDVMGNNGANDTGISYDAGPYRFRESVRNSYTGYANITVSYSGTGMSMNPASAGAITVGGASSDHVHSGSIDIAPFSSATVGGGLPHNNIQPSIAVYIWERTA